MPTDRTKLFLFSFLLMTTLIPATALGQAYSGSLTGVIKDPSGAVVPAAEVKLTDANKGYSLDVKSDELGRYLLRSLPPGTYRLSIVASGFCGSLPRSDARSEPGRVAREALDP